MEENNEVELIEEKITSKKTRAPMSALAKMYCNHAGLILFNLCFVAIFLSLFSFFSILLPVLYYIILIVMTVFSLGFVFVWIPNFGSWFSWGAETSVKLINFVNNAFPYLGAFAIACAAASIVLLLIDRNNRDWARIGVAIGLCSIVAIGLILYLTGVITV